MLRGGLITAVNENLSPLSHHARPLSTLEFSEVKLCGSPLCTIDREPLSSACIIVLNCVGLCVRFELCLLFWYVQFVCVWAIACCTLVRWACCVKCACLCITLSMKAVVTHGCRWEQTQLSVKLKTHSDPQIQDWLFKPFKLISTMIHKTTETDIWLAEPSLIEEYPCWNAKSRTCDFLMLRTYSNWEGR